MTEPRSKKNRSKLEQERRDYVAAQHLKSQRRTTLFVGPAMVIICLVATLINPCWQLLVCTAAVSLLEAALIRAVFMSRKGQFEAASILTMTAVISFTGLANLTIEGLLVPGVVAFLTSIFHTSLFTRRSLIIGLPAVIVIVVATTLLQHYDVYEFKQLAPNTLLILQIAVSTLMLGQLFVYLFQANNLNRFLITRLEGISTEQTRVISAANQIQPVIDEAVGRIEGISTSFAGEAGRQAVATSEVTATVAAVMRTSQQTAGAAEETKKIAETARAALEEDRKRLIEVEAGFESAVRLIDGAREQVTDLSNQVERIDMILAANHAIGEHIQVLSVNAAIEAAHAGEYGQGFHVVASELRDMIKNTEENLSGSKKLLDEIRDGSRHASGVIQEGAARRRRTRTTLLLWTSAVSPMLAVPPTRTSAKIP